MSDLVGFGPQLLAGAAMTLELAFAALALGLVLGLLGAAAKLSPFAWIRAPVTLFLNLLRGVPEFLILLIVYFGAASSRSASSSAPMLRRRSAAVSWRCRRDSLRPRARSGWVRPRPSS
jgi:His/Glu/Gln/Arg/opine family amino acid ABC transporter permease subunit